MAQIWLHSDWHLWHENIYVFTYVDAAGVERRVRERFANAAEGDAYMEQRWRDLIKPSDHVWVLGDVCMERGNHLKHKFIALFQSLPGHKRLIPGNHDHYKTSVYAEAGFEKISGGRNLDGILLTHYPVHASSITFKVRGNCHGHTHQQPDLHPIVKADGTVAAWMNVSVERTGYEPIPIEVAAKRLMEMRAEALRLMPTRVDVSGNMIEGP